MLFTALTTAPLNCSTTRRCTKKRSPPAQFWPLFRNAALIAVWIICVRRGGGEGVRGGAQGNIEGAIPADAL